MKLLERMVGIYAPLACLGCSAEGAILCADCCISLPPAASRCYNCNNPTLLGRTCPDCRQPGRPVSANAATLYDGLAKDLVWRLKFGRIQAAAEVMAACLATRFSGNIAEDFLIIPVPTARRRVRQRGYDQARLIARALARQTGCQFAQPLRRLGSQEQIGANRQQRSQQLQGSLEVNRPLLVQQRRILLVDDVLTTGATLETAATALYAAGASVVGGLVFAQA